MLSDRIRRSTTVSTMPPPDNGENTEVCVCAHRVESEGAVEGSCFGEGLPEKVLEEEEEDHEEIRGLAAPHPSQQEEDRKIQGLAVPYANQQHLGQWPHVLLLSVRFKLARGPGELLGPAVPQSFSGLGIPPTIPRGLQLLLPRLSGRRVFSLGGSSEASVCDTAVPESSNRRRTRKAVQKIEETSRNEERRRKARPQPADRKLPKIAVTPILRFVDGKGSWLNADHISAFLDITAADTDSVSIVDVMLFSDPDHDSSFIATALQQLLIGPATSFITIICANKHWTALLLREGQAYHYDPVGRAAPKLVKETLDLLKLPICSLSLKHHRVPRQRDQFNCGVFCLLMAEAWIQGRKIYDKDQEDLREARKRIVLTIMSKFRVTYRNTILDEEMVRSWTAWTPEEFVAQKAQWDREPDAQDSGDEVQGGPEDLGDQEEVVAERSSSPEDDQHQDGLPESLIWSEESSRSSTPTPSSSNRVNMALLVMEQCMAIIPQVIPSLPSQTSPPPASLKDVTPDESNPTSNGTVDSEAPPDQVEAIQKSLEGVLLDESSESVLPQLDSSEHNAPVDPAPAPSTSRPAPKRECPESENSEETKKMKLSPFFVYYNSRHLTAVRPLILTDALCSIGVNSTHSDIVNVSSIKTFHHDGSILTGFELGSEAASHCARVLQSDDLLKEMYMKSCSEYTELMFCIPEKKLATLVHFLLRLIKANPRVNNLPNFSAILRCDLSAFSQILALVGSEAVTQCLKTFSNKGKDAVKYMLKYDIHLT